MTVRSEKDVLALASLGAAGAVAAAISRVGRALPRARRHELPVTGPGLSVVIPERGRPDLLGECLAALEVAIKEVPEPSEVVVVVNGWAQQEYRELVERHPRVRWVFYSRALGFVGAIRSGIERCRHEWVYLLNSDMVLEPDALRELLGWRQPSVFAVASEIRMIDTSRRREETGWTELAVHEGLALRDVLPEEGAGIRGHLYAGGGASLFRRRLLRRYLRAPDPYGPFYWEDVEWGLRAWREGYEVLFQPRSLAHHHHRATVSRFYPPAEVSRVFDRNRVQFELRNRLAGVRLRDFLRYARGTDPATRSELGAARGAISLWRHRWHAARAPFRDVGVEWLRSKHYPARPAAATRRPLVLVVTPFAVCPPGHGSARRVWNLLRALSAHARVMLLGDEAPLYRGAPEGLEALDSIHLVATTRSGTGRIERIRSHSHVVLRRELERLVAVHAPDLVQIEPIELAALRTQRDRDRPWLIDLHDVLLGSADPGGREADRVELDLIRRHDLPIVCSEEDASMLRHPCRVVPNGAETPPWPYRPSTGRRAILFAGAFRYPPNWEGMRHFLSRAFPGIRRAHPWLELVVLGGEGARDRLRGFAEFEQPGVRIADGYADPWESLDASALTINPVHGTRGSSIKLLESIAAGRVCVSTRDGARGADASRFPSLIIRDRIEDLADPVIELLSDEAKRLRLEVPPERELAPLRWDAIGERLAAIHLELIDQYRGGRSRR